ncbi:MAG: hypothetical protein AAF649_06175 [Verrucomicrobiota bacterium]
MFKLFIAIAFWTFLSWVLLRALSRLGKFIRIKDQDRKSVRTSRYDPVDQAKKADIIDLE